ncbi:hypothetical protein RDI58_008692 [Solanum bulbocastanum]|uniref:Uncharacterized protein n=1 Tax=Solanum bulbocastanum TaxID=147425 RepID=A0AAN8TXU9_SOLBU
MGVLSKAGDWAFKAFSAGLGVATIFFAATFSANVYRGLSWHNRQLITNYLSTKAVTRMLPWRGASCFNSMLGLGATALGLRRKDLKSCSSKNDGLRSPALPHRVAG